MFHSSPPAPAPAPSHSSGSSSTNLEQALLGLYQGLTEMQTSSASTVKGGEALVARATSQTLASIAEVASLKPTITAKVPIEVIELLDASKNPHQHTRDLIVRASGENQLAHGKLVAVESYRKMLETSLWDAFPELKAAMMLDAEGGGGVGGDGGGAGGKAGRS